MGAVLAFLALVQVMLMGYYAESSPSPIDDIQRRSLVGMNRGDGNSTKIFDGGQDPNFPFDSNRVALILSNMSDEQIFSGTDEPSNGQARWAAKNIFQQVELYDFKHGKDLKHQRYFVEFGSRDGVYESNTFWYEKLLKWEGLLVDAGRDYMYSLRRSRSCRVQMKAGACVFAALAAQEDKTLYWNYIDRVVEKPDLTRYGLRGHPTWEKEAPTADDRAVKTMTLNHLMHHFGMSHVDFMSCDCEGCEGTALQGLNLDHYQIDVFTIESPDCNIAWMLNNRGYTFLVLPFSLDTFIVSPNIVQKMANAPDLVSCQGIPGKCEQSLADMKLNKLQKCNTAEQKLSVWVPGMPWPPGSGAASVAGG